MFRYTRIRLIVIVCGVLSNAVLAADVTPAKVTLPDGLRPFLRMLSGAESQFELSGNLSLPIDGQRQLVKLRLTRFDDETFDLALTHLEYAVEIRRRADSTALILPLHKVAYVGAGTVDSKMRLSPKDITARLISPQSEAMTVLSMASVIQPEFIDPLIALTKDSLHAQQDPESNQWTLTKDSPLHFPAVGQLVVEANFGRIDLKLSTNVVQPVPALPNVRIVKLPRNELERTLLRGIHRATEILAPAPILKNPPQTPRQAANG